MAERKPWDDIVGDPRTGAMAIDQDRNKVLAAILQQLKTISGATTTNFPFTTKTTTYTAANTDFGIAGDTTTAAFTITLPTAASLPGKQFWFIKINAAANNLTVAAAAGDTINGAATQVLSAQFAVLRIMSWGGTLWYIF